MTAFRTTVSTAIALLLTAGACSEDDTAPRAGLRAKPDTIQSGGDIVISAPGAPYKVVAIPNPGTVSGRISLSSPLEPRASVPTGKDSASCGPAMADESVSVQQQGAGVAHVVVWLEGLRSGKPLPSERRRELESVHCKLQPRVQAALVGSALNVLAHDNFRQQLEFVAGPESKPRATLLLGGGEQVIPTELPFSAPGMVEVRDTEHPWPRAYIAVFDHPYFATTSADGTFTLDGVPPGRYTLRAWHERTKLAEQVIEVTGGSPVQVNIALVAK